MYRNNLVRTTLSVFVACTLLYTASASAQSSTQLNSPALTPEFSDAPVVTSLGPLLSEDITGDESYTPEVIVLAQGTATEEAPTMILAQAEPELPQLETPMISVIGTNGVSPVVFWMRGANSANVENYTLRLYLGDDTSGQVLRRREFTSITVQIYAPVLLPLEPLTQYTVELIAQATGYRESNPATSVFVSGKANINAPTANELRITPSTDNITVTFEDTQPGVNGYALSIRKRFDDLGIAQSMQNFTISDSPITLTDLVPDRAYTLMALPTFESERYEYADGIASLDFMTRDLSRPPTPTSAQITVSVVDGGLDYAAVISWDNALPGVVTYEIDIVGTFDGIASRNALTPGELTRTTAQGDYTVTVVAINSAGERSLPYRLDIVVEENNFYFRLARPILSSVRLVREGPNNHALQASWGTVGNAQVYELNLYEGSNTDTAAVRSEMTSKTMHTFTNLPVNEYTVEVKATTTEGYRASNIARQTAGVLPEPESLQITTTIVDSNNLLVGWDNAAEGVTTYELTLIATTENRVVAIQEVSAVDGSETFAFEDIDLMTAYTLSVVAKGDASVYSPSPEYRVSVYQPQLETPAGFSVFPFGVRVVATGMPAEDIRYIFKLYLGGDTSSTALDTRSLPDNSDSVGISFPGLEPLTQYTVEIIARADNYRDSNPRVETVTTGKANINAPTANELRITESADNIRVNFQNTQVGVDGYSLSIQKRFDDLGVAKSQENFTIADNPITFTDLVPERAYTLMAEPTFNSERYEYTGGIVSLDFMTLDTPLLLPLRLRVFLEGPLQ